MEIFLIFLLFILCVVALWYSKYIVESKQQASQTVTPLEAESLIEAYVALRKFYEKGSRSLPKQALHLKKLEKMIQMDLQTNQLHRCIYDYTKAKLMQETTRVETA